MAVAVYERASTHVRPWHYIETSAGDLPTSGPFYPGDYYRDLVGRYFEWNGDHFVPIALATLGPVTIGTVDQGSPGASSWPVVEDNSADILTALGDLATQSTLQYLVDTIGNTNDAQEGDPTQTASAIALLKGILAKPSGGGGGGSVALTDALGWNQSCVGGSTVATATGPCRIGYVVVNYDAPVSTTVTIAKPSDLGSEYSALERNIVLVKAQRYLWEPDKPLHIKDGDSLGVTALGVTSRVVSVAIYGQVES